ncbi:MAG: NrsF family protein [Polyangiales bacterium]
MSVPDSLRQRVLAAAAANPSATRASVKRRGAILIVASIALALGAFEAAGGLEHAAGRPLGITLAIVAGIVCGAVALTWLSVLRGGSTLHRTPRLLLGGVLVAPVALFVWMHLFAGRYVEPFSRLGLRCFLFTFGVSLLPLLGFLVLRRRMEPRRPGMLGAGVGAACGAWSAGLVDLWCPLTNPLHVLIGHVAPLLALIVIGALFGSRLLVPRADR